MFVPPLNMGQFQPSPATMSQWIYQIWQFLQENPIATETEIREYIQSELTQSETLENAIDEYLTENPPPAPVQSVQGKTGAVQLAYNDIVSASNAVPVYKAASTPSTNTLTGQYNLGYRLFVNTSTQEIYTISPAGALSLVGKGSFDGTTIDLNTAQGDTTIAEAVTENADDITSLQTRVGVIENKLPQVISENFKGSITLASQETSSIQININTHAGYTPHISGAWSDSTGLLCAYPHLISSNTKVQIAARNFAGSSITNDLWVSILYIKN